MMMTVLSAIATIGGVVTFIAFLADRYVQYGLTNYIPSVYIYIMLALCSAVVATHLLIRIIHRARCFLSIPAFLNDILICTSSISIRLLDAGQRRNSLRLNSELKELCGSISAFFERLTRCPCAVCIKLLINKETGEPHVRTLVRDLTSDAKRRSIDDDVPHFAYTGNTAFNQIITRRDPHSFFLSNNLLKLNKKRAYQNANTNWRDYYAATLVVPIAATDNPSLKDATGFLCVDNQEGRFSSYVVPHVLSAIAKQLYFILTLNDRVLSLPVHEAADLAAKGGQDGAEAS